jgi:hypothetical protein
MSIPSIPEARRLRDDVVALGGSFPAALSNLLDLVDTVRNAPAVPNPVGDLIAAAVDGKANTPAEISKLITAGAKAEGEAQYFKRLQQDIERDSLKRFAIELRASGDAILDGVRPKFVETAEAIAAATEIVDPSWSTERLVAEGDSDQLGAYRRLPELVAVVDKFAAFVAGFGRRGTFPLLDEPQHLVHTELVGLRDEALFLAAGDPWQASELVNARRADWRNSPWLRMSLRLNTVAEARERLRALCESAFDAMQLSRGVRGRVTDDGWKVDPKRLNPFAPTEAA